jgi:hypothetical protein
MERLTKGFVAAAALFFACGAATPLYAQGALKVMTQGLGAGTVQATSGSVISCGVVCDENFPAATSVTLQANAVAGSVFEKWLGDCVSAVGNTCMFTMSGNRSVRAQFRLSPDIPPLTTFLTAASIQQYLTDNPTETTAAQFLRALPDEYKKGWILMSRSESLQTGTARFPRILLPSAVGSRVFTLGLAEHASYPGSHPDAIEFMQWDENPAQKTFRFHEIVLNPIPAMGRVNQFPARARGVSTDEQRCTRCHSTRNIRNPDPTDAGKPEAFADDVGENVDFSWKRTSDKDQGKLTYMHCLWAQGEKLTASHCKDLDGAAESTTASGLKPGTFYYWKVVVDDSQGATVDSETRRFQVQEKK